MRLLLPSGPLYVYVRDTNDLHAQILDALLGAVDAMPLAGGDWRTRLKALLARYSLVLFNHPEIARMAMSTQPSGPHYLSLVDAILALLREGGVPDREAAWGMDLLLLFATATAVGHAPPASAADRRRAICPGPRDRHVRRGAVPADRPAGQRTPLRDRPRSLSVGR